MADQRIVSADALSAIASDIKTAIGTKADASDVYTKTAVDNALALKADASNVYSKSEADTLLADKADIDGEYDYLTAGLAKQLKSNVGEIDKEPYNFRTSGGSIDIGDRETDKIIGGTVAFNQAVNGFDSNRSTINVSGNAVTVTSDGGTYYFGVSIRTGNAVAFKPLANHKYFTAYKIKDVSVTNFDANEK